jgi:hypothetical protein
MPESLTAFFPAGLISCMFSCFHAFFLCDWLSCCHVVCLAGWLAFWPDSLPAIHPDIFH